MKTTKWLVPTIYILFLRAIDTHMIVAAAMITPHTMVIINSPSVLQ